MILSGERLNVFPIIKNKMRISTLCTSIQITAVLASVIRQEKETKGTWIEEKNVKLYLSADNMILYMEILMLIYKIS